MKKLFKSIIPILLCIIIINPVNALSEKLLDIFDINGIFYYNPENENCTPSDKSHSSDGSNLTIIGDSITKGSESAIISKFRNKPLINAEVSRSWSKGIEVVKNTELKDIVVFALGTNTPNLTESDLNSLFNTIPINHTIVLVTNHTTKKNYEINNNLFKTFQSKKENVLIADWKSKILNQESKYLASDGIHPNSEGQKLFANLIYDSVNSKNANSSINGNKSYDGQNIFTESELKTIDENKPVYQSAANKYDLPWQLLAVLHRREHSLKKTNPSNGQGIYQLYSYTNGGSNLKAFLPSGPVSDAEFLRQTEIAAELAKNNYGKGLNLKTDDGIKTFFFRYNGTAKAYIAQARDLGFSTSEADRGEGSPYVMNRADSKRDPKSNPRWGQIKSDRGAMQYPANNEFGAFVMFQAIGGSSGYSSCGSSGGNQDINQTAIDLAWPNPGHGSNPTENYKKALSETGVNRLGDRWSMIGSSCDAFVATVFRYSGIDKNFVCCGVSHGGPTAMYVRNSGKFIEVPNDPKYLKPGDIRLSSGHIEIYVEVNGVGKIASASHPGSDGINARTGEILDFYQGSNFKAYRIKN